MLYATVLARIQLFTTVDYINHMYSLMVAFGRDFFGHILVTRSGNQYAFYSQVYTCLAYECLVPRKCRREYAFCISTFENPMPSLLWQPHQMAIVPFRRNLKDNTG